MSATVDSAVDKDNLFIPLIDFSHFTSGTPEQRKTAAGAVLSGFQKAGFIYLRNHPIPPAIVQEAFSQSAKFFKRPQAQKDELAWYSAKANRGYVSHGREQLSLKEQQEEDIDAARKATPDLKESLEIGRDGVEGQPNMWPDKFDDEGKEFTKKMQDFFEQCKNVHVQVMRAVALGLGIDGEWFDSFTDKGDNTLRLLHYPEVNKSVFKREDGLVQVRAGEHSDYGSITLLFQDSRGGLQVRSPNGTFVDATPIPDTIVINAGDLLERWSNDTIVSTKHRVIQPPSDEPGETYKARYSIAYFCNPNYDRMIEAIPGTYGGELGEKKYEGVTSGNYLIQRLSATYG